MRRLVHHAGSPIVRLGEGRQWGVGEPLGWELAVEECHKLVNGGHDDVHARDVVRGQEVDVAPRGGDAVVGLGKEVDIDAFGGEGVGGGG